MTMMLTMMDMDDDSSGAGDACTRQATHRRFLMRIMSYSEYIKGRASVVTRSVMCGVSLVTPTEASDILAGEYACIWRSCSRLTQNVRTDMGSFMLYISAPFSTSRRVTLTSGIESCTRCTIFWRRTRSESGTLASVCSGMVLRITLAIAWPRVSFAAMPHARELL